MNSQQFVEHVFQTLTDEDRENRDSGYPRFGALQNRPRLKAVASYCAENWAGDLVEIGCLHGNTTIILAEIARQHGRRVIAVDPWVELPMYGDDPYGVFQHTTEPWKDLINVVKLSSMDPRAIEYVENRPLCFAYVDGLHTYKAALSDISTVAHCKGIIAVDDIIAWSYEGVRKAFFDGARQLGRTPLDCELSREGYLV